LRIREGAADLERAIEFFGRHRWSGRHVCRAAGNFSIDDGLGTRLAVDANVDEREAAPVRARERGRCRCARRDPLAHRHRHRPRVRRELGTRREGAVVTGEDD